MPNVCSVSGLFLSETSSIISSALLSTCTITHIRLFPIWGDTILGVDHRQRGSIMNGHSIGFIVIYLATDRERVVLRESKSETALRKNDTE